MKTVKEKYRLSFFDEYHNKLGYLNYVTASADGVKYSLGWASRSRIFRHWKYCVVWSMKTNQKLWVVSR